MKSTFIFLLALLLNALNATSQDRVREIGVGFYNFDSFGLLYRTGTPMRVWRFQALSLSAGQSETAGFGSSTDKNTNYGINLAAGLERRKQIGQNLHLRVGGDVSFSFRYWKTERLYDNPAINYSGRDQIFSPGVSFVLGVNYLIKERFVLGVEALPGVSYRFGTNVASSQGGAEVVETDIGGFSASLSSSSALITLAYRL